MSAPEAAPKPTREVADIRSLKRYHALDAEERILKAKLKRVEAEMNELEPKVLAYFERQGLDRVTIEGVTLYTRCDVYAGKDPECDPERAIEVMRASGFPEYAVTSLSAQKISAFVRECRREGRELPPEWSGVVRVSEVWRVGCVKS